jgi:hypothetical protein
MKRRFPMATAAVTAILAAAPAANAQLPSSLPQVETPQVQTPQVQTPQVQAPQVQTPQVQTPQVQTPQVQVPKVQASRSVPQLPKASSASAPSPGGAQSAGGSSAGSPSSSRSAQPGGGTEPSSAPTDGGQSSWAGGRSASSGAGAKGPPAGERREAAFRRAVRRLQGCLSGLGGFERRVLVLRTGIGGRPQSVGAVAHRLHTSVSRVRAAEGAGLTHLRQADRRVGCGTSGGGRPSGSGGSKPALGVAVAATAAIVRAANPVSRLASVAGSSGPGRKKPRSPTQKQQGIAGVQASSPDDDALKLDRGVARHAAATGSDIPLVPILIGAFLVLLSIAVLTTLRRRAAATPAGGGVAAAPSGAEAQPKPERQEAPVRAPAAPPAVPPSGPSRTDRAVRSSRVGSVLGVVATRLSEGSRDLGRDVARRARSRRGRR